MAKGGHPTKLTPAIQQAIVTAVADGIPYVRAVVLAGISESTASEWLRRGENRHHARKQTSLYAQFARAVARAKAQDEARRILRINQAGQGGTVIERTTTTRVLKDGTQITDTRERYSEPNWQADAWHLERTRPDDWGRRERLDIRLRRDALAQQVADRLGVSKAEVLAEAEALLAQCHGER